MASDQRVEGGRWGRGRMEEGRRGRRCEYVLGTLGEDDADGELVDDGVEAELLTEGDVEGELGRVRGVGEDVVDEGKVITEGENGLPATKEREAGGELYGEFVLDDPHVRGGDVADFVAVVDLGRVEREQVDK
jgi:hypothetical protein